MSLPSRPLREPRIVVASDAMRALEAEIDNAARSDAKVLITGETGVGKEVVARLIHHRSPRASARMVTLNCAGLPDSLLESELFGHVKGSFTGAYRDKPGLLETAPDGTVFLDEVGEMSVRMQAVLLRFLETGEIQRIGADRAHSQVNVRLITATNRNLENEILSGGFREDLYFRLNVIRLHVPPLRERIEDVAPLARYYATWCAQQHRVPSVDLPSEVLDVLTSYRWPGNVRELRNVIERMVLKAQGRTIRVADLPAEFTSAVARQASTSPTEETTGPSVAEELAALMLKQGQSFWTAVYPLFIARDLTRADLRRVLEIGLEETRGNYRSLVEAFNMPTGDYKRFLAFLRKYDCHLPFQRFRAGVPSSSRSPLRAVVGGHN